MIFRALALLSFAFLVCPRANAGYGVPPQLKAPQSEQQILGEDLLKQLKKSISPTEVNELSSRLIALALEDDVLRIKLVETALTKLKWYQKIWRRTVRQKIRLMALLERTYLKSCELTLLPTVPETGNVSFVMKAPTYRQVPGKDVIEQSSRILEFLKGAAQSNDKEARALAERILSKREELIAANMIVIDPTTSTAAPTEQKPILAPEPIPAPIPVRAYTPPPQPMPRAAAPSPRSYSSSPDYTDSGGGGIDPKTALDEYVYGGSDRGIREFLYGTRRRDNRLDDDQPSAIPSFEEGRSKDGRWEWTGHKSGNPPSLLDVIQHHRKGKPKLKRNW